MADITEAKSLIAGEKYREAGRILDRLIMKKETHELWYLRGLVSLKTKSYDSAIEAFERAITMRKTALYLRMRGVARMELFELEEAIRDFDEALRLESKDLLSNFYTAVCYMFLDNPKSSQYLKAAYSLDSKRTKELLKDFYVMFFRKDPLISDAIKGELARRIDRIKSN